MDLYREEILEHWQNPQNWGVMDDADLVVDQVNPLCGDEVKFFFKIKKGRVEKVSFTGSGCAISIASSSILSEAIKNKDVGTLAKVTGQDVLVLMGGNITPARLKCAFLPLEIIRQLADKSEARISRFASRRRRTSLSAGEARRAKSETISNDQMH